MLPRQSVSSSYSKTTIVLTISSLHIGQTSRELAVAAAAAEFVFSLCSRDTRDLRSWISGGEVCAVEPEEVSDAVLADGDNRLEVLGGCGAIAGDKERPLPMILPPPIFLTDIILDLERPQRNRRTPIEMTAKLRTGGDLSFAVTKYSARFMQTILPSLNRARYGTHFYTHQKHSASLCSYIDNTLIKI